MATILYVSASFNRRILKNLSTWQKEQQRKAHVKDSKCLKKHLSKAKRVSYIVEDWATEQKKAWIEHQQDQIVLKHRPFVFGDD